MPEAKIETGGPVEVYILTFASLKNYYKILELEFTATLAEVKKAYRKLALQYHPDKTDNELLKAKFADIKEAYEVLSHPMKRKEYDLRFDNFSYKKAEYLTPYQLLQKAKALHLNIKERDPYRLDRDKLEFDITELLSEKNLDTLSRTEDKSLVQYFVLEVMEASGPLLPNQLKHIADQLELLADVDTRAKMKASLVTHTWEKRWDSYKIYFAIIIGILLCILIYIAGVNK